MAFARLLSFAVSTVAGAALWFVGTERVERDLLFLAAFLAGTCLFAVRPLRLAAGRDSARLAPCLPVLSAFALGASWGFALASFLAGFGVLLAGPAGDLFSRGSGRQAVRKSPAFRLLLAGFLLAAFAGLAFFAPLSPTFVLAGFCFSLGTFALSLWSSLSNDSEAGGRRSFSPVPILGRQGLPLNFAWAMLPFALVAMALAFRLLLPAFAGKRLPELACALSPMLVVLPALLAWGNRGLRKPETKVRLFSVDGGGKGSGGRRRNFRTGSRGRD
ncbi:MAG: hypothetical protein FWD94_01860 [Treponema sp.]|nr:hypothetical protein [Treponema sp.]